MLSTTLIATFSLLEACGLSSFQCSDYETKLSLIKSGPTEFRVEFENQSDQALCYSLGDGPRRFSLSRGGARLPMANTVPHTGSDATCSPVQGSSSSSEDFDLRRVFPAMRAGDRLCLTALVWPMGASFEDRGLVGDCIVV